MIMFGFKQIEHVYCLSGEEELNKLFEALNWLKTQLSNRKEKIVHQLNEIHNEVRQNHIQAMNEYHELVEERKKISKWISWIIPDPLLPQEEPIDNWLLGVYIEAIAQVNKQLDYLYQLDKRFGFVEYISAGDLPVEVKLVTTRSSFWSQDIVDEFVSSIEVETP